MWGPGFYIQLAKGQGNPLPPVSCTTGGNTHRRQLLAGNLISLMVKNMNRTPVCAQSNKLSKQL